MATARKSLGRGLSALLGEVPASGAAPANVPQGLQSLPVSSIDPRADQPRQFFDKEKLAELAESLRENGLIQPILVNAKGDGRYEIIAGERRWRASQLAGFRQIPAIVKSESTQRIFEMAVVENIQREDLTPVEEALGYKSLLEKKGCTHDDLAKSVGKSRSHVTNLLRILKLPEDVRNEINHRRISLGQAKVLAGLDEKEQRKLVQKILKQGGLSVRELEKSSASKQGTKGKPHSDVHFRQLEKRLRDHLQTKVALKSGKAEAGRLEIDFFSHEDLDRIMAKLRIP